MQVRPNVAKPKYQISNFQVTGNAKIHSVQYFQSSDSVKVFCICGNYSQSTSIKCCRCKASYHLNCIAKKSQGFKERWECPQCRNFYMDPIFTIHKKLIQTHYKTQSIFEVKNMIQFHFHLTEEQMQMPVQVRGLKDGKQNLFWPMQGQFYMNEENHKQPVFQLKPLLANSNRKNRKQQAFVIPKQFLKKGDNILKFYIPKLNGPVFRSKYQFEEKQTYFLGIYSINKLQKGDLISRTLKNNALQQKQSLKLLKQLIKTDDELVVEKMTVNLECPYMKSKIRIPTRGKYCRHYTCLCLQTLIQTRVGMGSRQWLCPICSKKINQPVIDLFLLKIVNDGCPETKITLKFDGTYEWVKDAFNNDDDSFSNENYEKQFEMEKVQEKTKQKTKQKQIERQIEKQKQKPVERPEKKIFQKKVTEKKSIQRRMKQKPIEDLLLKARKVQKSVPIEKKPVPEMKPQPQQEVINLDDDDEIQFEQIQIPIKNEDVKKSKQRMIQEEKEKNIRAVKESRNKKKQGAGHITQKIGHTLKEVKEMEFKSLYQNEFVKKYFRIDYNRNKIPEDLQVLFREVL